MTRYRWVAARKAEGFPITMACRVDAVSRQAFHDWPVELPRFGGRGVMADQASRLAA